MVQAKGNGKRVQTDSHITSSLLSYHSETAQYGHLAVTLAIITLIILPVYFLLKQLRNKISSDKEIRKFFLYAIGETILIVIGILLALQVNNWRDQQKDTQREKTYLNGILVDLKEDIHELNDVIEKDSTQFRAFTMLLKGFFGN